MVRGRQQRGFTLIEVMIVVAIIGILAAVAIPAFMKYIKKSKGSEAAIHVEQLYGGSKTYFETHQVLLVRASAPNPAATACAAGAATRHLVTAWVDSPEWDALSFEMNDSFLYQYDYIGTTAAMDAMALGDLDCDNNKSIFSHKATQTNGVFAGGVLTVTLPNE